MSLRATAVYAVLLLFLLTTSACRRTTSGYTPWEVGGGKNVVDQGDPVLEPVDGHAGSAVCRDCHQEIFDTWSETYHNLSTRETDRPGASGEAIVADSNGNGKDDFKDGLDLSTDPDFAAFGDERGLMGFDLARDIEHFVVAGHF